MQIVFLGYGRVGSRLASHLQHLGHEVSLWPHSKDSKSLQKALGSNPNLKLADHSTLSNAQVVFLCVPFDENKHVLRELQTELKGKILVDCTNPMTSNIEHSLSSRQSGSEVVQSLALDSCVVKAFSTCGFRNFEEERRRALMEQGSKWPAMFICGNDKHAKSVVSQLVREMGWQPMDAGSLSAAIHLEHMALLWVKMVGFQGEPNFLWSTIQQQ